MAMAILSQILSPQPKPSIIAEDRSISLPEEILPPNHQRVLVMYTANSTNVFLIICTITMYHHLVLLSCLSLAYWGIVTLYCTTT